MFRLERKTLDFDLEARSHDTREKYESSYKEKGKLIAF